FELDEDRTVGLDAEGACYIVVTNLPAKELSAPEAIALYKRQSKVERGFRFLKGPQFFTSALFLKKPERVQGLLTVMTLALLVYSLAERRLRMALTEKNETLPNQIKQETATPTLRWIFYLLKDTNRVLLEIPGQPKQCLIEGINELKTKILRLFGTQVELYYQLNSLEGCSM
ncbi:transposase, partial [bacterium (Candidatus Blackallbacteria) CG17_big_fil_post_rev_8_21_14_2_50_48_46]